MFRRPFSTARPVAGPLAGVATSGGHGPVAAGRSRRAFTLIELLIAVAIIGILAAILLPAVQNAFIAAESTQVVAEMQLLEKGILDFKAKYGVDPPSSFSFHEDPVQYYDPTNPLSLDAIQIDRRDASLRTIRKLFPAFDYTAAPAAAPTPAALRYPYDFDGDGSTDDEVVLNGSECLVFFLGGMFGDYSDSDTAGPIGFASSQTFPFTLTSSGNRVRFMEFDGGRFVDRDNDGFREYVDPYNDQQTPYAYHSSNGGIGYQLGGTTDPDLAADQSATAAAPFGQEANGWDNETLTLGERDGTGTEVIGLRFPYFKGFGATTGPTPRPILWNEQTYQIISPGKDGIFGLGGVYSADGGLGTEEAQKDQLGFDRKEELQFEYDNITNFTAGRLN